MQTVLQADNGYEELDQYLRDSGAKHILLVHGKSARCLEAGQHLLALPEQMGIRVTSFMVFAPNPQYESVVHGIHIFREQHCDMIVAIGGGSAMDVAKCIKLYAEADPGRNLFSQPIAANKVPLLAIPTTAGTGSESTRYAVIYLDGDKQSITSDESIPAAVLFDPSTLDSLPLYQRKATFLDALCHAMESYWSIHSNAESQRYSEEALRLIFACQMSYLMNDREGNRQMLHAANMAGKAINLTQTTAGHAMCYKLTSKYGIAHGHAAGLCVSVLWPYMVQHVEDCTDERGVPYLRQIFLDMSIAMGCKNVQAGTEKIFALLESWDMGFDGDFSEENIWELVASVHLPRLRNHPVRLDENSLRGLYREIMRRYGHGKSRGYGEDSGI